MRNVSSTMRISIVMVVAGLLLAACSSSGGSTAPSGDSGLLGKVQTAGKLVVSTDPNYAPQSVQKTDGTYEGFDIDVATEIAKRLGVSVEFTTPGWDAITAGSWAGRWDVSVGSMTITVPRKNALVFTEPYYYTPAQMAATTASGITSLDGLAGKTVCVGTATTYGDWLKGTLESVSLGPVATPPADVKVQELSTDQDCAQAIKSGRKDSEGFLTASTVIDSAISNGTPIVKVGAPVFTEQLAVSVDKSGPDPTTFVDAVSKIIKDMHDDGTLTGFSMKWFNEDLTKPPA